jgi:hypothetical protein
MSNQKDLAVVQVDIKDLKPAKYNPRSWSDGSIQQLTKSIQEFGLIDPILVNGAKNRKNVVIGGHFRLKVARDLGLKKVPVVYLDIPDENREKELNLRLNKAQGDWDWDMLKDFDATLLEDVGFDSEELDLIPYIKVLTKRGDLVVEPFCGSGSILVAATKLKRRCFIMEKSPTYAEIAMRRWELLTGQKRKKL